MFLKRCFLHPQPEVSWILLKHFLFQWGRGKLGGEANKCHQIYQQRWLRIHGFCCSFTSLWWCPVLGICLLLSAVWLKWTQIHLTQGTSGARPVLVNTFVLVEWSTSPSWKLLKMIYCDCLWQSESPTVDKATRSRKYDQTASSFTKEYI